MAFKKLTVLVEKERCAVKANGGLTGPGSTLDDDRHVEGRTDYLVLLACDRGDDVAHRPGPRASELGEQGIRQPTGGCEGRAVRMLEVLLDQVDQLAPVEDEPAAELEPEGVVEGCAVERDSHRSAPVDYDGVTAPVLDVPPPDVPGRSFVLVYPPEAQRSGFRCNGSQAAAQVDVRDGGVPVAGGPVRGVGDGGPGADGHLLETVVGVVQVSLLLVFHPVRIDGSGTRLVKPMFVAHSSIFARVRLPDSVATHGCYSDRLTASDRQDRRRQGRIRAGRGPARRARPEDD